MNSQVSKSTGSHIMDVINYMKSKIPTFLLFIHITFFNYVFETCGVNATGSDNFSGSHSEKEDIFVGYYVLIPIVCFLWEFFYCYFHIKKANSTDPILKGKLSNKDYGFCTISSIISVMAFLSTTFFMNIHDVNNCFMSYDKTIGGVLFFLAYALILAFSTLEKFCFATEIKIMATSINDPINDL